LRDGDYRKSKSLSYYPKTQQYNYTTTESIVITILVITG